MVFGSDKALHQTVINENTNKALRVIFFSKVTLISTNLASVAEAGFRRSDYEMLCLISSLVVSRLTFTVRQLDNKHVVDYVVV